MFEDYSKKTFSCRMWRKEVVHCYISVVSDLCAWQS